jgi:hypothetical protein
VEPRRERRKRRAEAGLGQNRRVDAVGEVAKLAEGGLGFAGRCREKRCGLDVALGRCTCAVDAQVVSEGEQALLSTVVYVAFEPAPLGISRLDDARARYAEVVELR